MIVWYHYYLVLNKAFKANMTLTTVLKSTNCDDDDNDDDDDDDDDSPGGGNSAKKGPMTRNTTISPP